MVNFFSDSDEEEKKVIKILAEFFELLIEIDMREGITETAKKRVF